ncbi:uncharacterized protein VP01_3755g1, partial [Puccinia sorghi]
MVIPQSQTSHVANLPRASTITKGFCRDYYRCKGSYRVVTLLICDQDYNILYVYTGWP